MTTREEMPMSQLILSRFTSVAAVIALAAALVACGAMTQSSVVLNDRASYLGQNFTAAQLFPPVKAEIDKAAVPMPTYKTLNFAAEVHHTGEDVKQRDLQVKMRMTVLGQGLVQEQWEYSNNGLPYRLNTSLSFGGVFPLRMQTLFLDRTMTEQAWDRRTLAKFDAGVTRPVKGKTYEFDGAWVMAGAMTGPQTGKTCVAGDTRPASTVNAALKGDLIELKCEGKNANGVVSLRETRGWLPAYGVALALDYTSSSQVSTFKYLQVISE